jgi:ligand-binding sensor domain-containing protein
LLLSGFLTCLSANSQGEIPFLTWRTHFSYNKIIDIAESPDRVYAAAPNGLFFVEMGELSVNKLTKSDGLSDVSIGAIGFDSQSEILVIGYANGNIDLVSPTAITNIRTFRDAPLIGSKRFHDISFNSGLAYLASDQGVLVVDLTDKEIIASYQNLGANGSKLTVFQTAFFQDSIYATTPSGILSASLNSEVNRQDFNNWKRALTNQAFTGIKVNGNELFAISGSNLLQNMASAWQVTASLNAPIEDFTFTDNSTLLLTSSVVFEKTGTSLSTLLTLTSSEFTASRILHRNGDAWIGDGLNGLTRYQNGTGESFLPNGPSSDDNWDLLTTGSRIIQLHGGFSEDIRTLGRAGTHSSFDVMSGWVNTPIITGDGQTLFDLVDYVSPNEETSEPAYLASFDRGLISVLPDEVKVVNEVSPGSTLNTASSSVNITAIAREGGFIWMTNYGFTGSLHRWEVATDTWTAYSLANSRASYPIDLFIAPNGDKWLPIDPDRGGGILIFNEESNRERYLNTNGGQGGLPGSHVTSLVLDDDFFIWVGTDNGIAFFPNFGSILDGNSLTASAPIFENRLLLRDEFITSIAIDPGNRKWFGTQTSGLWLFSETGEELVYNFRIDNSPLPSNNIVSLTISPQSGELFVGTDKGTVSFRSDATEGTDVHSNVTIFPNPVQSSSRDEVVINGLVNNALVKITDVSGKLVREIRAQGSTALWDGRDYNGQSVQTGVYLVFSSNRDGTETFVGKIAVI